MQRSNMQDYQQKPKNAALLPFSVMLAEWFGRHLLDKRLETHIERTYRESDCAGPGSPSATVPWRSTSRSASWRSGSRFGRPSPTAGRVLDAAVHGRRSSAPGCPPWARSDAQRAVNRASREGSRSTWHTRYESVCAGQRVALERICEFVSRESRFRTDRALEWSQQHLSSAGCTATAEPPCSASAGHVDGRRCSSGR